MGKYKLSFLQRSVFEWLPVTVEKLVLGRLRYCPNIPEGDHKFTRMIMALADTARREGNASLYSALNVYGSALNMILDEPTYRVLLISTASILTPPERYGGMERMVAYLGEALSAMGNEVGVIAKTGSSVPRLVGSAASEADFPEIVRGTIDDYDIVVDFSHDKMTGRAFPDKPQINTYQVMTVGWKKNPVFISEAQRDHIRVDGPVVYYGLNKEDYPMNEKDANPYLLYMGSIIPEKRIEWAIAVAELLGISVKIAGPSWTPDYFNGVVKPLIDDRDFAEYVGDVGGQRKLALLQKASALIHPIGGAGWVEAGAIIVQEAMSVGTPVIGSTNGCLPEYISDMNNGVMGDTPAVMAEKARAFLEAGYNPEKIRQAVSHLNSLSMAWDYLDLISDVLGGGTW